MLIGEKLCNLRKKEGWSQGELADKLNISRQTVSKWELNESLPDAENIVKISTLFNVTTDYLLKDEIDNVPQETDVKTKKYYTLQGILVSAAGILTLGIINIIANIHNTSHNNYTIQPFKSFVYNYGLEWLVYFAVIAITIGISILIRDLYIFKSKNHRKLTPKLFKLFLILTCAILILIFGVLIFLQYA